MSGGSIESPECSLEAHQRRKCKPRQRLVGSDTPLCGLVALLGCRRSRKLGRGAGRGCGEGGRAVQGGLWCSVAAVGAARPQLIGPRARGERRRTGRTSELAQAAAASISHRTKMSSKLLRSCMTLSKSSPAHTVSPVRCARRCRRPRRPPRVASSLRFNYGSHGPRGQPQLLAPV